MRQLLESPSTNYVDNKINQDLSDSAQVVID